MHPVALMGIHAQLEAGLAELELMAIQAASASEARFPGFIQVSPHLFPPWNEVVFMDRSGSLRAANFLSVPATTHAVGISQSFRGTVHGCGRCMHLRWNGHGMEANTALVIHHAMDAGSSPCQKWHHTLYMGASQWYSELT